MDKRNKFYYWGDIDRTGFFIYYSLINNVDWASISLFEEAYLAMVNKSKTMELSTPKKEQTDDYKGGLNTITNQELKEEIESILLDNKYIPQEMLNLYDIGGM